MTVELLAVGDMHLGRLPVGLGLAAAELQTFSPAAAWAATVREALRRRVDAVVLLGDVVDHDRDFFEAYSLLADGVRKLVAQGIRVAAVVGNHDVEVLPRLAAEIDGLQLVGRGGAWEELVLEGREGGCVRLVGWSFPHAVVSSDPTAALAIARRADIATIGIIHGDLEAASSSYAPLRHARLSQFGYEAWLLGHVHKPTLADARDKIGYLGSLIGLDAGLGELGLHGPWSVRVHGPGRVETDQLPIVPLRWEVLTLALGEQSTVESVEGALVRLVEHTAADARRNWGATRLVAARLRVEGSCRTRSEVVAHLTKAARGERIGAEPVPFLIESVVDATRPYVDLDELARQRSPAAGLARRLLALSGADALERERLLREARARERKLRDRSLFVNAGLAEPNDDELAADLLRAGLELLERMMPTAELRA